MGAVDLVSYQFNYVVLAGNGAVVLWESSVYWGSSVQNGPTSSRRCQSQVCRERATYEASTPASPIWRCLAFVASLAFMALEMVAGRLVQKHLGLEYLRLDERDRRLVRRLSFGNFLGGKIADFVKQREASELAVPGGIGSDFLRS